MLLAIVSFKAQAYILTHDENIQQADRFSLNEAMGKGSLTCVVDRGRLNVLTGPSAQLELLHKDPHQGETASAKCLLTGTVTLVPPGLQIKGPRAPVVIPGRLNKRVVLDGQEIFRNDPATQVGSGWFDVPLGLVEKGTQRTILIEILAIHPDPAYAWEKASKTEFRLAFKETK